MNPIEYARGKMWKKVKYTLIFEKGKEATESTEKMDPEGILSLPVAARSAHLTYEEDGRAFFISHSKKEDAFITIRSTIPETTRPEIVVIVMEHIKD
jgi:hypothetical protein